MVHEKRIKGNIGEDIACDFLIRKGFKVIDRNYLKKWGELDIVADKDNIIHFFEVKSVTGDSGLKFIDSHKPEDNVHAFKARKLRKMIQTYLSFTDRGLDADFQFHVLLVFMNIETRKAKVKWLKNVIL